MMPAPLRSHHPELPCAGPAAVAVVGVASCRLETFSGGHHHSWRSFFRKFRFGAGTYFETGKEGNHIAPNELESLVAKHILETLRDVEIGKGALESTYGTTLILCSDGHGDQWIRENTPSTDHVARVVRSQRTDLTFVTANTGSLDEACRSLQSNRVHTAVVGCLNNYSSRRSLQGWAPLMGLRLRRHLCSDGLEQGTLVLKMLKSAINDGDRVKAVLLEGPSHDSRCNCTRTGQENSNVLTYPCQRITLREGLDTMDIVQELSRGSPRKNNSLSCRSGRERLEEKSDTRHPLRPDGGDKLLQNSDENVTMSKHETTAEPEDSALCARHFRGREHFLTYNLLVELLSHQFTYPVRWIETQAVFFANLRVERLIEIGPGQTLTRMAQQSLQNSALGGSYLTAPSLLSFTSDADKIYFTENPDHSDAEESKQTQKDMPESSHVPQPTMEIGPMYSKRMIFHTIADSGVEVKDILRVIIGSKSKRRSTDISMSSTIRASAGGRSTLQNELLGEIEAELGRLPDGAEDMTLEDLHNHFQSSFSGKLGPNCKKVIHRMMIKRMPPSLDEPRIRQYLVDCYNLGKGLQDTILLIASTVLPDSRTSSEGEVYKLLGMVVDEYALDKGIYLPKAVPENQDIGNVAATKPVGNVQALLHDEQRQTDGTIYDLANASSGTTAPSNAHVTGRVASQLRGRIEELQAELDSWADEYGPGYIEGIESRFCIDKQRVYDSWWNWGLQQLWLTYTQLQAGTTRFNGEGTQAAIRHILNCPGNRLDQAVCRMLDSTPSLGTDAGVFLQRLHSGLQSKGTATSPRYISTSRYQTALRGGSLEAQAHQPSPNLHSNPSSPPTENNTLSEHISVRTNTGGASWPESPGITDTYRRVIDHATSEGVSFSGHRVLLIGSGPQSIGAKILQNLLAGGADVLVTTSNLSSATAQFYSEIYASFGGKGSRLVLVPYNQASVRDVTALVEYIYDPTDGLGWDLDHIVPFAALLHRGGEIDGIDSHSELAHRAMMTNTVRLLGAIKTKKVAVGSRNRPTQVILPLSPNHGMFGGDGLYSESKLGLESLLHRWYSESWQEWLSITGAIIGWTRGTGLMSANDRLARSMADVGVRTFSAQQMADSLTGLFAGPITSSCQLQPLLVDLSGGMSCSTELTRHLKSIQSELNEADSVRRAVLAEHKLEARALSNGDFTKTQIIVRPRASPRLEFPPLAGHADAVRGVPCELQGLVDLSGAVVIVGYSEIGPFGNSRTRWDVECNGELSVESCIELAWMTGRIKHFDGLMDGESYCGWVDVRQGRPIHEADMKSRYGKELLSVCGIREINGPSTDVALQEITLQQDLDPLNVSKDEALQLQAQHGASVEIMSTGSEEDNCTIILKKGASMYIPRNTSHGTARVAGRIPDGWDPGVYGIPDWLTDQVDPVTIYALVGTVEALLCAGITDPYELYNHIPVSKVANCLGSGQGGMKALQAVFRDRAMDRQTPPDVLQETFVNTTAAWINMLLLSSAGPIKTPVGACATALESMDTGRDLIANGRAHICIVGGVDDLCTEISDEFGRMKATVDVATERACGRSPAEMSRPGTSSRSGFVEAHGCGVQILASADLALTMGLPIYGVVALTGTASDKTGRSVPAPGKGIATLAQESEHAAHSPLLDVRYRRRLLELQHQFTQRDIEAELSYLDSFATLRSGDEEDRNIDFSREREIITEGARLRNRDALRRYGNDFWKETDISPIRGSLAVWGLTPNDVIVASLHGTSTRQGDRNEIELIHQTMEHLGRERGNPVLAVCQKYLTGHPKGPAGAWMANGCLQILQSGFVPGNRNADNIDAQFEAYDHVLLLRRGLQFGQIEACSVTSFGFGQKGAQAILVHPRRLLAVLNSAEYEQYRLRSHRRQQKASRRFQEAMLKRNMFIMKDGPPYNPEDMMEVLLNS